VLCLLLAIAIQSLRVCVWEIVWVVSEVRDGAPSSSPAPRYLYRPSRLLWIY